MQSSPHTLPGTVDAMLCLGDHLYVHLSEEEHSGVYRWNSKAWECLLATHKNRKGLTALTTLDRDSKTTIRGFYALKNDLGIMTAGGNYRLIVGKSLPQMKRENSPPYLSYHRSSETEVFITADGLVRLVRNSKARKVNLPSELSKLPSELRSKSKVRFCHDDNILMVNRDNILNKYNYRTRDFEQLDEAVIDFDSNEHYFTYITENQLNIVHREGNEKRRAILAEDHSQVAAGSTLIYVAVQTA